MNILILGGSHFVGPLIAKQAKKDGHFVGLFNRGSKLSERTEGFFHFRGDLKSPEDLKNVAQAKKWDVVIHQIAYQPEDIERVLEAFPAIGRIVMTSSISVYRYLKPDHHPQPFVEEDLDHNYSPKEEILSDVHWAYARGKKLAEKTLLSQKKIPYTILRHSFTFGPHDAFDRGHWYGVQALNGQPIFLADHGLNTIKLLFSEDAAKAILLAGVSEKGKNEIFNVAQSEIVSLKDYVDSCVAALGISPSIHNIPSELLQTSWKGPLAYHQNWVMDTEKIVSRLGFIPTPFENAIRETMSWLKAQPQHPHFFSHEEILHQKNFLTEWKHLKKQIGSHQK